MRNLGARSSPSPEGAPASSLLLGSRGIRGSQIVEAAQCPGPLPNLGPLLSDSFSLNGSAGSRGTSQNGQQSDAELPSRGSPGGLYSKARFLQRHIRQSLLQNCRARVVQSGRCQGPAEGCARDLERQRTEIHSGERIYVQRSVSSEHRARHTVRLPARSLRYHLPERGTHREENSRVKMPARY